MKAKNLSLSQNGLIVVSILFLMLFANVAFFKGVVEIYPLNLKNLAFLISLFVVFTALNAIIVSLFCYKYTIKLVLILIFLLSSFAAYFMDSYRSVIDENMIDNILQTNTREFLDLLSIQQVLYVLLLGFLPSILIYKVKIKPQTFLRAVVSRSKLLMILILISVGTIWAFSDYYASFFREHKSLRYYSNPGYYLFSAANYSTQSYPHPDISLKSIALDAKIPAGAHRKLMIFVIGETVRADHFSLNGYDKKTNPLLEKLNVINFSNTSACGTSTAHSVPCLFSVYQRHNYDKNKVASTENVLDILRRVNVNVLWLDNNSSSKGVADRVLYQDYKTADNNPVCDSECRDVGMLGHLQTYIDSHPIGDFFIVLHQMGNHGPAYYKRYPKEFEQFTPVCKTNQLEQCTKEQISNAYDNAILYTDYFLAETIALLKQNSTQFESALFYAGDHGESLGENGLYLHGLPYFMAPKSQTHVPMFIWMDNRFGRYDEADIQAIKDSADDELSHDNIFHTVLGFMQVETNIYDKTMDIIHPM